MSKKKKDKNKSAKDKKSSVDTFLTFWSTLPGILTGIAALLTAVAGLYLAFAPAKNGNSNQPAPTPSVSATQGTSSPTSESSPDNCLEPEFAQVQPIEVETGERPLIKSSDGVIRIKLADERKMVGALSLRYYPDDYYFKIEKVVDAKCNGVEGLINLTKGTPVTENKLNRYDRLKILLNGRPYSLRLLAEGSNLSAKFEKL